jgi:hypothetical protein
MVGLSYDSNGNSRLIGNCGESRTRRFEQVLRVDRPPFALGFASTSSLPATQGQR